MTTTQYTPENLKRWTLPSYYAGAHWEDYYSAGVGQSRDSDALERANFDAVLIALKAIPEPTDWSHDFAAFRVVRESHWGVGWVEWIAIHESATAHLREADRIKAALKDYPVVDETRFSEYENDDANQVWKDCYRVKERLKYIREHKSQFEFRGLADLLGCVRGNYFAGYASELLH